DNPHPPQQFVPIYVVVCQSPPPDACSAPSWCHRPYPADTWRLLNERVALWPIAFHCLLSLLLYFFYATVDKATSQKEGVCTVATHSSFLDVRAEHRKEFARIVILCRSFEEGERNRSKTGSSV